MIDLTTVKQAFSTRFGKRRLTSRARRARTLGAAGFAGVSVALLASELSASGAPRPDARSPRFAPKALADDLVAMPVRFADAGSASYLRPGDRIDVLAADESDGTQSSVPDALSVHSRDASPQGVRTAVDVSVLAVPGVGGGPESTGRTGPYSAPDAGGEGGLVFLAVDNPTAARLARAAVHERLTYALHPS
jgi:hypothetical protein